METIKQELVILVDDNDQEIGTALKATVHTHNTPLHRAFSVYIFRRDGKVLVQQRKKEKITWGGFWSNSCCGHPGKNEDRRDTVVRRSFQELDVQLENVEQIEPYRYRFEHNGIVENEICPIFAATTEDEVKPDPKEIEGFKWLTWQEFLSDMRANENSYSPWSKEQANLLDKSDAFRTWLAKNV